jgi:hypothetical protein
VWFISFGDLLTLLLCFFLVLTPWDKLRAKANLAEHQGVVAVSSLKSGFGTEFAPAVFQSRSSVLAEMPIYEEQLGSIDLGNLVSLAHAYEREIGPVVNDAQSITLTVCAPDVDRRKVLAEVGSLVRSVVGESANLGIEVASTCQHLDILRPTTAEVVGVVSVRGG